MKRGVIASGLHRDISDFLQKEGIDVISFPECRNADKRIAFHSDIVCFYDGETLFLSEEMKGFAEKLGDYCKNVEIVPVTVGDKYPSDVPFNCVLAGKNFICNKKTVSQKILESVIKKGYNVINVRQGYTKCSVALIDDNALITDDEAIYTACRTNDIDALLVSKGSVRLEGFPYGFIGGTAGRISRDTVVFNGSLSDFPERDDIYEFAFAHNVKIIESSEPLCDIGSIIPLYLQEDVSK